MKALFAVPVLFALITTFSPSCHAEDSRNLDPERQMQAMNDIVDELRRDVIDRSDLERVGRGERLNDAFVILTGEAVNPLFGVAVLGVYNYLRTDEALRPYLPIYDQPIIWVPLLVIIIVMLLNSTLCEAMPFLKVPLNALGDIVNKVGAVAVLPLMVKMFADAVAQPAAHNIAYAADLLFPAAHAAEGGVIATVWYGLGWLLGAVAGLIIYMAVWMTFNVIDVLILICPFPGIDLTLKSFRLSVIAALAGTYYASPTLALVLAVIIVLISLFLAGWSFRLSVFGLIFSTDVLFFRSQTVGDASPVRAFSTVGMVDHHHLPLRTMGTMEKSPEGDLLFCYRPWLILPKRRKVLGPPSEFACGIGLFNLFLVETEGAHKPWLRLPPRYCGSDDALVTEFGLRRTLACGTAGSFRTWLRAQWRGKTAQGNP